jgi:ribonuclease D
MNHYTLIEDGGVVRSLIQHWKDENIESIAMDFEGEFNLHIYGEHLALIQIYDGHEFFLIDPVKLTSEDLRLLLEESSIEKVMFDCSSDASLVYRSYNIRLSHVFDIRISSTLLGYEGSLSKITHTLLQQEPLVPKKAFQRANWLKRPLSQELIAYALSDVKYLLQLKEILVHNIKEKNLEKEHSMRQANAASVKTRTKKAYLNWREYHKLNKEEQQLLMLLFDQREILAKKENLPPYKVMSKQDLIRFVTEVPLSKEELIRRIRSKNRRIREELIEAFYPLLFTDKTEG